MSRHFLLVGYEYEDAEADKRPIYETSFRTESKEEYLVLKWVCEGLTKRRAREQEGEA